MEKNGFSLHRASIMSTGQIGVRFAEGNFRKMVDFSIFVTKMIQK